MADFVNTIDVLGDDAVADGIINRTIKEFKDDSVLTLGENALYKCTSLETVDFPNVKSAKKNAFSECTSLVNVSLPSLETSNMQLFQNCTRLKSVSLPAHTGPLNYTFMGCSALESIDIPKATYVAGNFIGGSAITKLRLPSVVTAGNGAFRECAKLTMVDLPVCTSIAAYALYNLPSLKTVVLRKNSVCALNDMTALGMPNGRNTAVYIYVPSALIDSYKAAANWSTFADQFRSLEEWTVDGTVTGELSDRIYSVCGDFLCGEAVCG